MVFLERRECHEESQGLGRRDGIGATGAGLVRTDYDGLAGVYASQQRCDGQIR